MLIKHHIFIIDSLPSSDAFVWYLELGGSTADNALTHLSILAWLGWRGNVAIIA
jgi:hypothetical protein